MLTPPTNSLLLLQYYLPDVDIFAQIFAIYNSKASIPKQHAST